jgi:hypothetical protein
VYEGAEVSRNLKNQLDVYESVHRNIKFIEKTSHRSGRQPKMYVKPEAAITVFELLVMGGVSPKTC